MNAARSLSRRSLLAGPAAAAAALSAAVRLPRKIRVAMIGLDGHPTEVTGPLPQLPDVDMVGLYDPDPATVARFARNPRLAGAARHTDWRRMLDALKPDVVGVCHANSDHAATVVECLERGIHVICEKPIATELADLARMKKAVESGKARFTAMLPMRLDGPYAKLKELVAAGEIGEVVQIDGQKSYQVSDRPKWFFQRKTYGGTMPWIGIHMVDLMLHTSGRDFTEAFGYQNHIGFPETGDTENLSGTVFKMDNGGVALLRLDYLRPKAGGSHGDDRLRLAGTKGIAEYLGATGVTLMNATRSETIKDLPPKRWLFAEFLDHIYNGKPEPIAWKEIHRGHQIVLGARDAMESGKVRKL